MKQIIINVINSDPELKKTLEILKANQPGAILRRYEERYRKSHPEKTEDNERMLAMILSCGFYNIKYGLQFWTSIDIWEHVKKASDKKPDETYWKTNLFEALDTLQLNAALLSMESHKWKNIPPPPPLPHNFERAKPIQPLRW